MAGSGKRGAAARGAGVLSALRLKKPAKAAPQVKALQDESQRRLGYVRNFLQLPIEADRLTLLQGYLDRLMRSDDAALPPQERELLALVVSVENRCDVCVMSHAVALQRHGLDKSLVDTLTINWRSAALTKRQRALAEFAWRLTARPTEADESYLDLLRRAGLREEEILEAAQIVAIYNANNRFNTVIGLKVNPEAHAAFRKA
ncbi:MAG: peroxidase-related enzyme [Pseudolabrys sp.]